MHPAGHFATAAALSSGVFAATRSTAMTAGAFAGGFLIDLDHLFDYVTFNRQRNLHPSNFLRYYLRDRDFRWVVLPLHAYELMCALAAIAYFFPHPLLLGYLIGAALHMGLDVIFNQNVCKSSVLFYSILYRAARGFSRERLIRTTVAATPGYDTPSA